MEKTLIHYIDDDDDDRLLFLEATYHIEPSIILHLYEKHENLFKALEKVTHKKEIVFLDLNMPGKTGTDILKEIRAKEALKKLPIIIYSTSKDSMVIKSCMENGASMYVVKPTSFNKLEEIIKKIIEIDWIDFKTTSKNFVLSQDLL